MACSKPEFAFQDKAQQGSEGSLVELPDGHHMFLECSGAANAKQTVILVTGRGLGTANSWSKVQQKVDPAIRVSQLLTRWALAAATALRVTAGAAHRSGCPQCARPFSGREPYAAVSARRSFGWRLAVAKVPAKISEGSRRSCFVDSSHEEMEWRDAAVAPQFDQLE